MGRWSAQHLIAQWTWASLAPQQERSGTLTGPTTTAPGWSAGTRPRYQCSLWKWTITILNVFPLVTLSYTAGNPAEAGYWHNLWPETSSMWWCTSGSSACMKVRTFGVRVSVKSLSFTHQSRSTWRRDVWFQIKFADVQSEPGSVQIKPKKEERSNEKLPVTFQWTDDKVNNTARSIDLFNNKLAILSFIGKMKIILTREKEDAYMLEKCHLSSNKYAFAIRPHLSQA